MQITCVRSRARVNPAQLRQATAHAQFNLAIFMNFSRALSTLSSRPGSHPDRIGVAASVFCAIHCAATPLLLLFAPAFGQLWAHPASHWIVALLVVPLAGVMVVHGFRRHRRIPVLAAGIVGMALVVAGAAVPYWEMDKQTANGAAASVSEPADAFRVTTAGGGSPCESAGCDELDVCQAAAPPVDTCCPSLGVDESGKTKLVIPLASVVTTLGGLLLIATHLGNLCCLSTCRQR